MTTRTRFARLFAMAFSVSLIACGNAASTSPGGKPPDSSTAESPWPRSHRTEGQQAVTPHPGPDSGDVQVRQFVEDAGRALGTSPFMVLSGATYRARPQARTVWGATLTDVFKYEVDGDTFRFADSVRINALPLWVGWNLFRLPGDRFVVPDPNGLQIEAFRGTPCFGTIPSLLVFEDGATPDSPIRCTKKFEFSTSRLQAECGFRRTVLGTTAVLTGELPSGDVAVSLVQAGESASSGLDTTWLAVLDPLLERIVACAPAGEGTATNQFPVEEQADGSSRIWVATGSEIIAMRFDPATGTVERSGAVPISFRGRTGTTPTLMDTSSGDRLLVLVDGRCAVSEVFTGAIRCSEDDGPSRLVIIDRDNLSAPPRFVSLPGLIDTIENSPAATADDIVVANYSGYTPDGEKDGQPDFARGIAKLSWTGATFELSWLREDLQVNGVPTISTASNAVYGSGAEQDGLTWFYALDLNTGETQLRTPVGPSMTTVQRQGNGVFDAGNNTVINDDGSAIFPGGETLVRVR